MRTRRLGSALLGVGLLAGACGGDGSEADLDVTLRDGGITLSRDSLEAGDLTLASTNEGTLTHEFEVFLVPDGVDANALSLDGDTARADEMLEVVDEVEDIAPGTSAELSLNLEAGNYAVICNLPGHYASGMHATFTVT